MYRPNILLGSGPRPIPMQYCYNDDVDIKSKKLLQFILHLSSSGFLLFKLLI